MERINQLMNGVLRSERYSRFTLQPTEDGERHAEIQLSEDATEDGGSPTFRPALPSNRQRSVVALLLGTVFIFAIGCLVGFFSHSKPWLHPSGCKTPEPQKTTATRMTTTTPAASPAAAVPPAAAAAAAAQPDYGSLALLLSQSLTSPALEKALKKYDVPSRSAGGAEDRSQGRSIYDTFKSLMMEPWTDVHYVQLQTPDRVKDNRVLFGSNVFKPKGYLAYSPTGHVQGKLVYGNYGSQQDLDAVERKNVSLKASVVLLRAGRSSFSEQVQSAACRGVAAVLIYPDGADYDYRTDTALYGHVHMGFGDPYTPGFPSFNHTQFPPTRSSGLPTIPAQTISGNTATALLRNIDGPEADSDFRGQFAVSYKLGGSANVTVEVNNALVNKEIHNVFGVIKGFTDPDQYVVLGAQRDAWGRGYAKANVGTSLLMELARTFRDMVEKGGFRPRRSLVFASWSAGEYGNVGATEWLEAHMASTGQTVVSYVSLDGAVMGRGGLVASASPLLYSLLQSAMKQVESPFADGTLYDAVAHNWEAAVLRPMSMEDPSYPFLAFSGIPSVSFHFITPNKETFRFYGTELDTEDHLQYETGQAVGAVAAGAAQFAAHMALRLSHDHLLPFDVGAYKGVVTKAVVQVYRHVHQLTASGRLSGVGADWLNRARGSFNRAADGISNDIINTDITDKEACRLLNQRLMMIERSLLSPYVSPVDTPLRHLLLGRGPHTLASIAAAAAAAELHTGLALATWSLQGCANAMEGNIWELDNQM